MSEALIHNSTVHGYTFHRNFLTMDVSLDHAAIAVNIILVYILSISALLTVSNFESAPSLCEYRAVSLPSLP